MRSVMAAMGYGGIDIARSIGRTEAATRTMLCRARAKVRTRLTASKRPRHDGRCDTRRYHRRALSEGIEQGTLNWRTREIARLKAALDGLDASPPAGRTIVIGGEAGIGKSRLVGAVLETAQGR